MTEQNFETSPFTLHLGDCIEVMRTLPDNSVDAVVTDPPYGIRFMGKAWDGADIDARAAKRRGFESHAPGAGPNGGHKSLAAEAGKYDLTPIAMRAFQEFSEEWAREAFRVLKPGGHLLSFSSARTYHRMTAGIEDAGFEIRDQILWLYGTGFPKSHNLDGEHKGWGTALKPAHEPICVARKPLDKGLTVAANMAAHGIGAVNIAGCMVQTGETLRAGTGAIPCRHDEKVPRGRSGEASSDRRYIEQGATNFAALPVPRGGSPEGRWPANLIHDGSDAVVALFPSEAGQQGLLKTRHADKTHHAYGEFTGSEDAHFAPHDVRGSAARFFYCAKTSKRDRNDGCEALPQKVGGMVSNTSGQHITRRDDGYAPAPQGNTHPTVKPTDLMAYLVRLVTPRGGTVLDPFMGSGSTGKAAMREGMQFIGIDMAPEYVAISTARIENELAKVTAAAELAAIPAPQFDLFQEA